MKCVCVSVWTKSACMSMFTVHCLYEKNTAWVCKMVCVSIYCMYSMCVCVCKWWQSLRYFFLNSDKARVSAARYALALLHCIHTHTYTRGIISHFPYLSMTLCVYVWVCVCVNGVAPPYDRWAPNVAVHMGVEESHFWMQQPSHLPRIFWNGGGFLLNWTDSRSVQVIWQDPPGCWNPRGCQIRPKWAKSNHASDQRPAENYISILCKLLW